MRQDRGEQMINHGHSAAKRRPVASNRPRRDHRAQLNNGRWLGARTHHAVAATTDITVARWCEANTRRIPGVLLEAASPI